MFQRRSKPDDFVMQYNKFKGSYVITHFFRDSLFLRSLNAAFFA